MRNNFLYYVPEDVLKHNGNRKRYRPVPIIFVIYPAHCAIAKNLSAYQEVAYFQRFLVELQRGEGIALLPPFHYSVATTQRHILIAAEELGFSLKTYPNPHSIIAIRIK